jgi:hypothetical protein
VTFWADPLETNVSMNLPPDDLLQRQQAIEDEQCLCGYEGPDYFGNYDLIENDRCPLHGKGEPKSPIPPGCRECPMCAGVKGYYRRYSNTWMPCHFCDGKGYVAAT